MNSDTQTKNNLINIIYDIIKKNLKALIILFVLVFSFFLIYQGYLYVRINKINNQSISYFKNIELDDELRKFSEIKKISNEKGFYAILSKLDLIKYNIDKKNYNQSLELYKELINSKDLDNYYKSLIAIVGAYNFIDIVVKNNDNKYINHINDFIYSIDDSLENYIGHKNELIYLVTILSLDNDSKYKNNSELLTLYDNLMNNEKISSTIKERVKKIHEFFVFI